MNVLIFDTETVSSKHQWLVDIGYHIVDIDLCHQTYTTLCKKDYLVLDLINNELFMRNVEFGGDTKFEMWQQLLENKTATKHNFKKIMELIGNDIKKYKVVFGYAFNAPFDCDKFAKECLRYGCENPIEHLPIFDIWKYATNYITNTKEYFEFVKANNFLTESQRFYCTNVDTITKFLLNDLTFSESHTALDDTFYELMILMECYKRGADITREMSFNKDGKFIKADTQFVETIEICGENAKMVVEDKKITITYNKEITRNGVRRLY